MPKGELLAWSLPRWLVLFSMLNVQAGCLLALLNLMCKATFLDDNQFTNPSVNIFL